MTTIQNNLWRCGLIAQAALCTMLSPLGALAQVSDGSVQPRPGSVLVPSSGLFDMRGTHPGSNPQLDRVTRIDRFGRIESVSVRRGASDLFNDRLNQQLDARVNDRATGRGDDLFDDRIAQRQTVGQLRIRTGGSGLFDDRLGDPRLAGQLSIRIGASDLFDPRLGEPILAGELRIGTGSSGLFDPRIGDPRLVTEARLRTSASGLFDPRVGDPRLQRRGSDLFRDRFGTVDERGLRNVGSDGGGDTSGTGSAEGAGGGATPSPGGGSS